MRPRRLAQFDYRGPNRYFLTMCTFARNRWFTSGVVVRVVHAQIARTAALECFAILAYCYMPDHLHLLVEGTTDSAHLAAFAARAKQRAAFGARHEIAGELWQRGYFERVLRRHDDVFDVARYIVQNPLRAGLVTSPSEYPFLGSDILSTEQLIESCAWKPPRG